MARMSVIVPLVLAILSGCISSEDSIGDDAASALISEDHVSQENSTISAHNLEHLSLDHCIDGGTAMEDPESKANPDLPDGWRYFSYSIPLARLDWKYCDYIAYGGLELSDVSILMETNHGPMLPESCADYLPIDSGDTVDLVRAIWVSDSELMNQFESIFGERVSSFELEWQEKEGLTNSISWSIAGVQVASLELQQDPNPNTTHTRTSEVFAWEHNGGISFWSASLDELSDEQPVVNAVGTVTTPHRNPSGTDYWNGGASNRISNSQAEFHSFEDTLCETPSS